MAYEMNNSSRAESALFKCSLNREGLSLLTRNSYIDPHMIRRCKELWRIIINLLAVY